MVAATALALLLPASAGAATFSVAEPGDPAPGACTSDEVGTDPCSLREAVIAANANPGPDTIELTTTVTLTRSGDDDDATNGDLDVTDDLTIEGDGGVIDADRLDRVLDVPVGGPDLTVKDITVKSGKAEGPNPTGGGIRFQGATPAGDDEGSDLTIDGATLSHNDALPTSGVAAGGSIWAGSTGTGVAHVTIKNSSTIEDSHAGGGGDSTPGDGGAIAMTGPAGQELGFLAATITANHAGGDGLDTGGRGGAVFFDSPAGSKVTASLTNFTGNEAGVRMTGTPVAGSNSGGAIQIQGGASLSTIGSTITGNTAGGGPGSAAAPASGGGIFAVGGGDISLHGTSIADNRAGGDGSTGTALGGGVYTENPIDFNAGSVNTNHAGGAGIAGGQGILLNGANASLTVAGTVFNGNGDFNVGNGGAISNNASAPMEIDSATFNGNNAVTGAAIFRQGSGVTDTISRTSFTANTASSGTNAGAAFFSSAGTTTKITGSTFSGNIAPAGDGGALYIRNNVDMVNSTISGNGAGTNGGGVYVDTPGTFDAAFTTIGDNSVVGDGGNLATVAPAGKVTLFASLLFDGDADGTGPNCHETAAGGIDSLGYNVEKDTDDCNLDGTGDHPMTDPVAGALADNGGPTQTRRPFVLSPAVDLVPGLACTVVLDDALDQREKPRPRDANGDGTDNCDAGSVELQPPTLSSLRTNPASGADNNTPSILGSTDLAAQVGVYPDAGCADAPLASGTGSTLNGAGFPVHVPDNSTTTFYVRAGILEEGVSPCTPVTYQEVTKPLDQGPPGFTPIPPRPKKPKCKKGKKPKKVKGKFKCVKKKKRKK